MQPSEDIRSGEIPGALYRSIAVALRKELLAGRWRPGDCIPPEKQLAERFGVSLGTVRGAIHELVKAGLLVRQQGRGTFVSGVRLDHSLERFFRYERRNAAQTLHPETRVIDSGLHKADKETARALGLKHGSKVGWLRRLRLFEGEPCVVNDSYFPPTAWRSIQRCDFSHANLYAQLQERCGISILQADEYLTADIATPEEARLLALAEGSPIIRLERLSHGFGGAMVEYRRSFGRGDRFSYHVRL